MLATARATAYLVELRAAVAICLLDHHYRGVRDVDPALDHAGCHQYVCFAAREGRHGRALVTRAHLAMHDLDPEAAELSGGKPLPLSCCGPRLADGGLLHQWANHEALTALA